MSRSGYHRTNGEVPLTCFFWTNPFVKCENDRVSFCEKQWSRCTSKSWLRNKKINTTHCHPRNCQCQWSSAIPFNAQIYPVNCACTKFEWVHRRHIITIICLGFYMYLITDYKLNLGEIFFCPEMLCKIVSVIRAACSLIFDRTQRKFVPELVLCDHQTLVVAF